MKHIIVISLFSLVFFCAKAQEFNVTVQVTSPQVEGTEKKIFETLQQELFDFVNNRKWTNYIYKPEERIEGTILITVEQRSGEDFKGKINVALRRPVFKSSYNTTLLNYLDRDFEFKYVEFSRWSIPIMFLLPTLPQPSPTTFISTLVLTEIHLPKTAARHILPKRRIL